MWSLLYSLYVFIHENVVIFQIPLNAGTWILGLLVADLLAYWFHRLSHEINFLWAAHIVHHQSEELNMTTVFRVSAFAVIFRSFFFIWLPIIGFSPALSTSVIVFIGLYQFLTHTRLVGKLGFLEYIFVTPSSHRVHHGRDDKYKDTNYGHVFIIWDRLFGTYREEEEEPDYGITTGFESSNAYWAYLSYWNNLFSRAQKMKNLKDRIRVFIKPPSWTPKDQPLVTTEYEVDESGKRKKYHLRIPLQLKTYVFINVMVTMAAFVILLINKTSFPGHVIAQISGGIAFTALTMGMLMEQRILGWRLEFIRLLLMAVGILILFAEFAYSVTLVIALIGVLAIFAAWLFRIKGYFSTISPLLRVT